MLYIFLFSCLIATIFIALLFFFLQYIKIRDSRLGGCITNFESYMAVFIYHMERAYEIIYKEKILIYSLEGMRLSESEFQAASKDFATLVLKMIGPNVKESLADLYGDEETLLFNIMEYFSSKFENDEVYKSSLDNIINNEQLPITEIPIK